jgi:hypothetical protein
MKDRERIRMEVLLEEVRDKVNKVAEGIVTVQSHVTNEINDLRGEMNGRFNVVELAIKNLSGRVGNLENGQKELLGRKVEGSVGNLEGRFGNLEVGQRNLEIGQLEIKNEIRKIHFRLDDHEARLPD